MNLALLVLAMGVVTFVPRMLPMVILQKVKLPPFVNRFLKLIPYTALGALIFPGVLASTGPDNLMSAILGSAISVTLAFCNANIMLVVGGGILGAFLGNTYF